MIHQSHTHATRATQANRATNDTHRGANATTGTGEGIGRPHPYWVPLGASPIRLFPHQATESANF